MQKEHSLQIMIALSYAVRAQCIVVCEQSIIKGARCEGSSYKGESDRRREYIVKSSENFLVFQFLSIINEKVFIMKCSNIILLLVLVTSVVLICLVQESNAVSITVMRSSMRLPRVQKIRQKKPTAAMKRNKNVRKNVRGLKRTIRIKKKWQRVPGMKGERLNLSVKGVICACFS